MEDKKSSSILKTPLYKGISKEIWKMEENFIFLSEIQSFFLISEKSLNSMP